MIVENHTLKSKEEFKTSITVAYYNAYFQRVQKMPKLESVLKGLDGKEEKKEMSSSEMLSMVQQLHRAFGGA